MKAKENSSLTRKRFGSSAPGPQKLIQVCVGYIFDLGVEEH
jgi:hypothetical protein